MKNIFKPIVLVSFLITLFFSFGFSTFKTSQADPISISNEEIKVAYFASGCFWCVEAIFESVIGVKEAVSGYAGGHTLQPTYQSIGTGKTGHAETVAVYYDPKKVSFYYFAYCVLWFS